MPDRPGAEEGEVPCKVAMTSDSVMGGNSTRGGRSGHWGIHMNALTTRAQSSLWALCVLGNFI